MSARNPVVVFLFSLAAGVCLLAGLAAFVAADAGVADPSMAVAETHLDGGGPVVADPVDAPSSAIADPLKNPAQSWDDIKAAKKTGWPALVLLVSIVALTLLSKISFFEFLRRDRVVLVISGAIAVLSAAFDAIMLGGTWVAALYAAGAAGALYWRSKYAVVRPAPAPMTTAAPRSEA